MCLTKEELTVNQSCKHQEKNLVLCDLIASYFGLLRVNKESPIKTIK